MSKSTLVILGEHYDQFIKEEVKCGRYATASEVIRNGLRKLEEERHSYNRIDDALIIGEASGKPKIFDNEAFKRKMRKKYAK